MTKQEYINSYWQSAINACAGSPIFPIIALAESALESSWGESYLTKEANNFLGLKSTDSWEASGGEFVWKPTHEHIDGKDVIVQAKFRKYDSPEKCFKNYVHFVTQPHYIEHGVDKATTPEEQIRAIAATGYATDPSYSEKVIGTIHGLLLLLPKA